MVNASTAGKPAPTESESQAASLFADAFNPAAWMGQQTRMAEACAASGRKYLEGLQEIASQSLLLQSALAQQMVKNALSLTQASGAGQSTDEGMRAAASAMESTVESIRNVMTAACKCHTDTLGAFQERLSVNGHAKAAMRGAAVDPAAQTSIGPRGSTRGAAVDPAAQTSIGPRGSTPDRLHRPR